jgi:hypothetical protein
MWRIPRLFPIALAGLLASCASSLVDFDEDGVPDEGDCAPADPEVHPNATDVFGDGLDADCDGADGVDRDGDGWAASSSGGTDCNDDDADIHPGAVELPDNSIDEDCDDVLLQCDADGDGVFAPACGGLDCDDHDVSCADPSDCDDADSDGQSLCHGDCDDQDPARLQGADELCDGLDNDCNGELLADERDVDGDGTRLCDAEPDCDDTDPTRHPAATELCNGVDDACAGALDPQEVDDDGDGQRACDDCDDADPRLNSLDIDGDLLTSCDGDCDDVDANSYPGASDGYGDGADENCDGIDGVDADGDGLAAVFEDCDDSAAACTDDCDDADGDGVRICDGDCDDTDARAHPGAVEVCDALDTDCDGVLLPDDADDDGDGDPVCTDCDDADPAAHTLDADGDGEDTCGAVPDCDDSDPLLHHADLDYDTFSSCTGDCSDFNPNVHPGAPEACDGLDDDCDGTLPADESDGDNDGYAGCADCDDTEPLLHPGALEVCDGVDDDCDGQLPADELDSDGDGWATCTPWVAGLSALQGGGDCDDAVGTTYPTAPDGCDDTDNDCNGVIDDTTDLDGDGFCVEDCGDGDPLIFPGAWTEVEGDGVDSNCDGEDWFSVSRASVRIDGTLAANYLGRSVAGGGDFDDDGRADLVVGAPHWNGYPYPGAAYVFSSAQLVDGAELSEADALTSIRSGSGQPHGFGQAMDLVGDMDGNGLADLLVGAEGQGVTPSASGGAYVFLDATLAAGGSLSLADADYILEGADPAQYVGSAVTWIEDLDGDGGSEVLVGSWGHDVAANNAGRVWLVLSSQLQTDPDGVFALADAQTTVDGSVGDRLGEAVADGGDLNCDGLSELVASMPGFTSDGGALVIDGAKLLAGGALEAGIDGLRLTGANGYPNFGRDVVGLGDLDGDCKGELAIGAPGPSVGSHSYVYVFHGANLPAGLTGSSQLAYQVIDDTTTTGAGASLARAGDIDGDGVTDLLVGAPYHTQGGSDGGKAYVMPGAALATDAAPDLSVAVQAFVGEQGYCRVGGEQTLATAGDVDGDGRDDVLVAGDYCDSGRGAVYVLFNGL